MEEELVLPPDPATCHVPASDVETEKVKDFVFKHFREVSDGSLISVAEESSMKDYGSPTKRDGQMVNRGRCRAQQGAVFSGKILSFECSVCKDGCTYSPNDLLKHFRAAHRGTLPTYPCDLCGFYTHEFPALQRHRMEHRNTLVTCELCNNGVQYSLLLLTRHYIMNHSINGQFSCDWCNFNTVDAGTFVQHIHHHNESPWKCPKCRHISLNEEDHQKHLKAHTGTFPYTCQICGYGAARSDYLKNHTAAVHKDLWKPTEDIIAPTNSSAGLKLLLKKSEAQEAPRVSKLNHLPSGLINQNGRLLKTEIGLDESPRLVEGIVGKKEIKMWSKVSQTSEQSEVLQEYENSAASDPATLTNPNGLTVLMVKNKISLPPNCTTKVMGFRMVEGKKHLVLKVIPTAKQDSSNQNGSLVEDVVSSALNPLKNKVIVENGEGSHTRSSRPHSTATSPRRGSGDQDEIMTVKVKIEEEETFISSLDSAPHGGDTGQADVALSRSSSSTDSLHPQMNELAPSQRSGSETSSINNSLCCDIRGSPNIRHTLKRCAVRVTDVSAQLNVLKKNLVSRSACEVHQASPDKASDTLGDKDNCHEDQVSDQDHPDHTRAEGKHRVDPPKSTDLSSNSERPAESPPSSSCQHSDICTLNSPSNQEVFSFHNYSKEAFCSSPNTHQTSNSTSKNSADRHSIHEPSHFSLSLSESPELCRSFREDSSVEDVELRTGADSDGEVNECIVNDPLSEDENPESVLQDFNIIKIEEESVPISKQQVETKSPSEAVEEQPGPIISQQVAKEAVGPSVKDVLKPTKTTLRILQLGEGQQPVLLRTSDSQFAVPLQVKASPGFKLITNSTSPQINVSYMSPATDRANKPSPNPINRRVAVSAPKTPETGTALLSAVQSGVTTSSNHFFINSPGFKGPVLLSSTPHTTPTDKSAKTPPTCYLLQRSVPLVQTPTAPALRLASTQLPLTSRPVLAMPVNPADKPGALQAGRQAFLLRYISPPKPSTEAKAVMPCSQTNDSSANKVIFKIVTPTGGLLTSAAPSSSSQPLFLATRPQTQCFLVSSNKANANANTPSTVKKLIAVQREVKDATLPAAQLNVKVPASDTDKPVLAPRSIRTPSQRKRRRRTLFDPPPETAHKSRRLSHRGVGDKETPEVWRPAAKDHERTLRLSPLSPLQQVKCPRRYQPVVVLNHPDADIPEVSNIMKVVNRHRGAVSKVSLSSHTVQALSKLHARQDGPAVNGMSDEDSPRPAQSLVQERFILKMKLRRKSRRKYRVVSARSGHLQPAAMFTCWFCGRLFNSQEDWIGHGQRHLMEATRDWNTLS